MTQRSRNAVNYGIINSIYCYVIDCYSLKRVVFSGCALAELNFYL